MTTAPITGIHHVSAISSDVQKTMKFYADILGLRLVKRTVNFDNPEVYHLYFGNERGEPGSLLTFFPYQGLKQGRHGTGMLNTTTFSVPVSSIDFWMKRFETFGVPFKNPQERFGGEAFIYFEDEDGLGLELVFNDKDKREGSSQGIIPKEFSIRGFYNVEIWQEGFAKTEPFLTGTLNHELIAEQGNRFRFAAKDEPGNYVDVVCTSDALKGFSGSGTVHHIAFATTDTDTQMKIREKLRKMNVDVTFIKDRKYFKSIYFQSPAGVLFEVATSEPGFTVDESFQNLGTHLMLPDYLEFQRSYLEKKLPEFHLNQQEN